MFSTSAYGVRLRSAMRGVPGLKAAIVRLSGDSAAAYEQRFDEGMRSAIRPGDVVWDVGANVGHYTERFASWCAPGGRVVALEPSPGCQEALARFASEQTTILQVALSDSSGEAMFDVSRGEHDVQNQLSASGTVPVEVANGDALVADGRAASPDVVKVDVEGYEPEVLSGLSGLLQSRAIRELFVEVHFGALARRGMSLAPVEMERRLRGYGYDVTWLDSSHLRASVAG